MRFLVSPFVEHGVDCSVYSDIVPLIQASLNFLEASDFSLDAILVVPMILGPRWPVRSEYVSYRKTDNAYYVGVSIDYFEWMESSARQKLDIALNGFREAICKIPQKKLTPEELGFVLMAFDWAHVAYTNKVKPH